MQDVLLFRSNAFRKGIKKLLPNYLLELEKKEIWG
jgi:hypothetical protein